MSWEDYEVHVNHQNFRDGGIASINLPPPESDPPSKRQKVETQKRLPPWMGRDDIDNDFVQWEHMRKEHIEAMRQNPDYRFVMQVASFTNERLDKYWNGPTGSATGAGIQTNMNFGHENIH